MLVLRRKTSEGIVMDQITIRILAVEGERVKIGIEAPDNVPIVREELLRGEFPGQERHVRHSSQDMGASGIRVDKRMPARHFLP